MTRGTGPELAQHVPRRMSGKTAPQGHAVVFTTQEASDVANIDNNSLNWVSISSAGALDSERWARDEMIHTIGSSEPDVSLGLTRIGTEDVRRRTRTISNFCANCTKHELRWDGTLCAK